MSAQQWGLAAAAVTTGSLHLEETGRLCAPPAAVRRGDAPPTLMPSSMFSPPYTSIPGSRRPISPKNFRLTTKEQPIMAGVLRERES